MGLANLVFGCRPGVPGQALLIREILLGEVTGANLAAALRQLLVDTNEIQRLQLGFQKVRELLSLAEPSRRAAREVLDVVRSSPRRSG